MSHDSFHQYRQNKVNDISSCLLVRSMERIMLGLSLRDRVPNTEVRRRSGVTDCITRISTLKWNWAGHLARINDDKSTHTPRHTENVGAPWKHCPNRQ